MPTVVEFINEHIKKAGVSNSEITKVCGFGSDNTVSMIRRGKSKLPIGRIERFAKAIQCDPKELFRLAMGEYQPEILDLIDILYSPNSDRIVPDQHNLSRDQAELLEILKEETLTPREIRAIVSALRSYRKALYSSPAFTSEMP